MLLFHGLHKQECGWDVFQKGSKIKACEASKSTSPSLISDPPLILHVDLFYSALSMDLFLLHPL